MTPVSRTSRIIAFGLDLIAVFFIMICSLLIGEGMKDFHKWIPVIEVPDNEHILYVLLAFAGLSEALTGITPGKAVLRIVPATWQGKQGNIPFYMKRFLLRYFPIGLIIFMNALNPTMPNKLIPGIITVMIIAYLITNFMFFLGQDKSALHDFIIKGKVIKRNLMIKINP